MITLMQRLIDSGHAYAAGGDVYFDVTSFPEYGALSGQRLDHMRPAEDTETAGAKRDPRDFTLWKGAKPGEPSWETPWGPGRPGWHLECSAMATAYLGSTFDIHGGGLDLVFPHHENEVAQSHAAGDGFARYWMHNGLVGVAGEKMSKSLGNSLLVDAMVTQVRPVELRYYLGQAHYRSRIEYSPAALDEAVTAYRRIEGFVDPGRRARPRRGDQPECRLAPASPSARRVVPPERSPPRWTTTSGCRRRSPWSTRRMREGNNALAAGDASRPRRALGEVRAMLGVLGLDPLASPWAGGADHDLRDVVDALVMVALDQRQAARARKDYAGRGRDQGESGGCRGAHRGHAAGPRWEIKR